MRQRWPVFLTVAVLLAAAPDRTSARRGWVPGTEFLVDQFYICSFDYDFARVDLVLEGDSCPWRAVGEQPVIRPLCGDTVSADLLAYNGCPLSGDGGIALPPPYSLAASLRLNNATIDGAAGVGGSSRNLNLLQFTATGEAQVRVLGTWVNLGHGSVDLTMELCPEMEDVRWPLQVGDSWTYTLEILITAHYYLNLTLFGQEFESDGTDALELTMLNTVVAQEPMFGCPAMHIQSTQIGGPFSMDTWHCLASGFLSRKVMRNLVIDGFVLDEVIWNAREYGPPTPTPVPPTPTRTPTSASSATAVVPTRTPTPAASGTPGTATPIPPPPPERPWLDLDLNSALFREGDMFMLGLSITNPNAAVSAGVRAAVLLDVWGEYFAWPSWQPLGQGLDYEEYQLPPATTLARDLLAFSWPGGVGSGNGVLLWGALFQEGGFSTVYYFTVVGFSFQ